MRELLDLFWTFARIGGLTFGGGYAMLPILQREVVEKRQWVSDEELMDYYAIGQCTPGIIAREYGNLCGAENQGDNRRYYSDIRSGFSIFGDHYSHCRFYPEFCGFGNCKKRFCRDSHLCLRSDSQRSNQVAEKLSG